MPDTTSTAPRTSVDATATATEAGDIHPVPVAGAHVDARTDPATPDSPPAAAVLASTMDMLGMPSPAEFQALRGMAEQLAMSKLVPRALYGCPADIMVILLTGRDLRIGATMALSRIYVLDGKPSMSAELMVALVLRAGHRLWPDPANDGHKATVHAIRDGMEVTSSFTFAEAEAAGLTGKAVWKQYPASMLWARAVSRLCRQSFPDVLMGVTYTPEELDVTVDEDGNVVGDPYAAAPRRVPTADEKAQAAGWRDLPDYQDHKVALVEAVKALDPAATAAFKAWRDEQAIPHAGWTRNQHMAMVEHVARLANPDREVFSDPIGSGPVAEPVVAPAGFEAAATYADGEEPFDDGTPGDDPTPATADGDVPAPAEPPPPPRELTATELRVLVEHPGAQEAISLTSTAIKGMSDTAVTRQLREEGIVTDGNAADRKARLGTLRAIQRLNAQ